MAFEAVSLRPIVFGVLLGLQLLVFPFSVAAVRSHTQFSQVSYYTPDPTEQQQNADPAKVPETTVAALPQDEDLGSPHKESNSVDAKPFSANPDSVEAQPADFQGTQYTGTNGFVQTNNDPNRPWWYNRQYSAYQQTTNFPSVNNYAQQQPEVLANYDSSAQYSGTSGSIPYELTGGGCPTQYWISNIHRWSKFFNVKSTVGDAFGQPATNVFGGTTLLQALLNTRQDGYSTLLNHGAAAILNSYGRAQYKYSHIQVIEIFNAGLSSRSEAAAAAAKFEEANKSSYVSQYDQCN